MTNDAAHCCAWRACCVYRITGSEPVSLLVGWLLVDGQPLPALSRQWLKPLPLPCLPSWLASILSQPITQHTICIFSIYPLLTALLALLECAVFLQNIGRHSPNNTASYPRRQNLQVEFY